MQLRDLQTLLRSETMTASAWLHKCKYHHIPELTEQVDNRSKSSELSDAFVDIPFMLDSGDMVQGRRGMLKICDGDRSAFTCNNRDMFLQTSAPCRSPNKIYTLSQEGI